MTAEAYAKVNLTLEVFGRRPDGFHALRSVVQPIELADTLSFEASIDGKIESDTGYGDADLAVRAARALRTAAFAGGAASPGVRIKVVKRIPAGGGLGGGSADAAATLVALNALWGTGLSVEELCAVGASVGSDVPALVLAHSLRGPVMMEGRGELVRPLTADERERLGRRVHMVLANPGVESSTAEAYAGCNPRERPLSDPLASPVNDLQEVACRLHPEISGALDALASYGAEGVMMSGSGATVFGFAADAASAESIADAVRGRGFLAWSTRCLA